MLISGTARWRLVAAELTRMEILGVFQGAQGPPVVILSAKDARGGGTDLPIWIDPVQAHNIQLGLHGASATRPTTHDLLCRVLDALDARVGEIVVEDLEQTTFYGQIAVDHAAAGGTRRWIDARPSDCLALAARVKCPIFARAKVLKAAGVPHDQRLDVLAAEQDGAAGRHALPRSHPPELAAADLVRVEVEGVYTTTDGVRVFLSPAAPGAWGDRVLAMPIDQAQAMSIQLALDGQLTPRPFTHDLFSQILNELGAIVDQVVIDDFHEDAATFFATLALQVEREGSSARQRFDARPSDGIALAVRVGAPILVANRIMQAASIPRKEFGAVPLSEDEGDDLGIPR
ncbi:MAG: uncharacterized protein QOE90_2422 [Thermoplasmata archaeon]|nr:uncharacterized protein [Thermoplasmata archaeon]